MIWPGMPTLIDEIRSKIDTFAADLTALVRRAALEVAASALGGATVATPAKAATPALGVRKRGGPKKTAPAAPTAATEDRKRRNE